MKKIGIYSATVSILVSLLGSSVVYAGEPAIIGDWDFDTDSGVTIQDGSGDGNGIPGVNLDSSNFVPSDLRCSLGGNMLRLNGTDEYAQLTGSTDLRPTSFTFSAWFKASSSSEYGVLGGNGGFGEGVFGYFLFVDASSSEPGIGIATTNGVAVVTEPFEAGEWYFVAGTYDSTDGSHNVTVKDVDGNSLTDDEIYTDLYGSGGLNYSGVDGFSIGAENGGWNSFHGDIENMKLHKTVLSDAEIDALASCPASEDTDGIDNEVEAAAPNSGDANNDGTPDNQQANVASTLNSISKKYVTVDADTCSAVNSLVVEQEKTPEDENDDDYDYPVGLIDFTLSGCGIGVTETITQYYYGDYDPGSLVARKYDPASDTYTTIESAVLSQVTIGGESAIQVVYSVTDGGDLDTDGVANGVIVDPVGLGVLAASDTVGAPDTGFMQQSLFAPIAAITAGVGLFVATKRYGRSTK